MATEKSTDEQIQNLQRQLDKDKPKSIDEQIEDIRRQIREDEEEEVKKKRYKFKEYLERMLEEEEDHIRMLQDALLLTLNRKKTIKKQLQEL